MIKFALPRKNTITDILCNVCRFKGCDVSHKKVMSVCACHLTYKEVNYVKLE